jgi:hypothetical protein
VVTLPEQTVTVALGNGKIEVALAPSSFSSEQNIAVTFAASKKYRSHSCRALNIMVALGEQAAAVSLGKQMIEVALAVMSSRRKPNIELVLPQPKKSRLLSASAECCSCSPGANGGKKRAAAPVKPITSRLLWASKLSQPLSASKGSESLTQRRLKLLTQRGHFRREQKIADALVERRISWLTPRVAVAPSNKKIDSSSHS